MANSTTIAITGLGMISPVGLDMVQTCAAVRAGVDLFEETEDHLCLPADPDLDFEPMKGSRVPTLASGVDRNAQMMKLALQDLIERAQIPRAVLQATGLYLATGGEDRIGSAESFAHAVQATTRERFRELRVFAGGHAGFFLALEEAMKALSEGRCAAAIVAGVDSHHLTPVLTRLDEAGRIKSERSLDGFIPGEAAAALLVEMPAAATARGAAILATLHGVDHDREEHVLGGDEPSSGTGLARAIERLAQSSGAEGPFLWTACDMNGESYRGREWAHCQVNKPELFRGLASVWHPADCLGDTGAASGPVLACLAARAFERGYAPADQCLIWASSDDGLRGATLIRRG
jgi:3-oxoacyl-[acyl-carrier-protein] synthase-1